MGGLSAEREVSLQSGAAVLAALQSRGYNARGIDVDQHVCQQLIDAQIDIAFVVLHGRYGEDGCIQGLLESMHIPYTGSGVLASALAMDKVIARKLMETESIPTPVWRYPVTPELVLEMGLPAVIKPRSEGSSVGLTILREAGEIASAIEQAGGLSGALVERYIMGRELSVAVLGQGDDARCLGSVEIRPAVNFYDYDAKYNRNDTRYIVPAPVPEPIQRRIAALALAVHRLLGCAGATRTDFLWDEQQEPVVLEINTIPGMTGHSLLPMIAAHAGLSYEDVVEAILEQASLKAALDCNPIR